MANLVYHVWKGWGLVTVHANAQPLYKIILQIQRQGHATIKTNLPGETPVTMNVEKVPLGEALETLAAVTDARCRLTYFLAADRTALQTGIDGFSSAERPEGWKTIAFPMPPMQLGDEPVPDPRKDEWNVKPPAENTLQAYLGDAAKATDAGFALPVSWNPEIQSPPASGRIEHVVPRLARTAHGKVAEIFLLTKSNRENRQRTANADGGDQPALNFPPGGGGPGPNRRFDPAAMEQRMQAEIEKLPVADRAAAQARFDQERAFWKSARDLPPDQRREKMEEHFNDPEVQKTMDERMARNDARRTPEQRMQRYQRYVNNKLQMKAGNAPQR